MKRKARAAPRMATESDCDSDLFGSDIESEASDEAPASTKKQLAEELDDAASTPPSSPEREVSEADEDENLAEYAGERVTKRSASAPRRREYCSRTTKPAGHSTS